ncbi:cob(I)yrinic acid a,c-diamide adenosyltransferase [Christensenella tenuis]|jgi:cob(I)alamin adenosyltransferase|uniref:Cob(I)yrinic acid a,c-diamide adenosyltransferase n=1 Tax=Christensenella tenuis TaxID=2763033 RepID=A0ABR7EB75_9FIRM|nr:cob(I)yrinic acid a,c-diamide adenosyltransferase [Christensenella tenuis]MBC5647043.1 cob(I)yrinic acid a,c-diamide adenosyltransferase [Christensenella tenuis]
MKGLIHIYCGDGKEKTTTAVGIDVCAARHAGYRAFLPFMKRGLGEMQVLIDNRA